ncbi:MAG: hypothetical protein M3378_03145 [Actinomycetota bacterium]|nr:hypothetical protein [Actinomycetota bacterium]
MAQRFSHRHPPPGWPPHGPVPGHLAISAPAPRSRIDPDKTFQDPRFAVTFTYPGDFNVAEVSESGRSAGGKATDRTAVALDEDNLIFISKTQLTSSVAAGNVGQVVPEANGVVGQLSGKPAEGQVVEVGGLPGIRYPEFDLVDAPDKKSRLLFLFRTPSTYSEHPVPIQL